MRSHLISKNYFKIFSFTGLNGDQKIWTQTDAKNSEEFELNLENLDLEGIAKLFTVLAGYWHHLAIESFENELRADWPIYFMPQPLLDFESDLNLKDYQFISEMKNFNNTWKTMSFGSCESTDCCKKFNHFEFQ